MNHGFHIQNITIRNETFYYYRRYIYKKWVNDLLQEILIQQMRCIKEKSIDRSVSANQSKKIFISLIFFSTNTRKDNSQTYFLDFRIAGFFSILLSSKDMRCFLYALPFLAPQNYFDELQLDGKNFGIVQNRIIFQQSVIIGIHRSTYIFLANLRIGAYRSRTTVKKTSLGLGKNHELPKLKLVLTPTFFLRVNNDSSTSTTYLSTPLLSLFRRNSPKEISRK